MISLYITDLTQGEKWIGIFYNIFRGNVNKNLLSRASISSKSIYDKTMAKKRWSLSKIVFWTSKQPFSINFFSTTCNVCPEEILEIFAQTYESDSAPCHHIRCGWRLSTARWWSYSGNLSKSAANLSSTAKGVFLSAIARSRLHFFSSSHVRMTWFDFRCSGYCF